MSYAKVENNTIAKYPYSFIDLKKDNPNVSFPNTYLSQAAANNEYNVVEVVDVSMPAEEGSHAVEAAYGRPQEQIEYITENGLEAWQAKVAEIKAKYPKT